MGGRLASLKVHGQELLVTQGSKPSRHGSFPMAPWAGRLSYGRLAFEGTTYDFPLTSPPHANHGTVFLQPWTAVAPGVLQTTLDDPWPFGGFVRQTFVLADSWMTITMEVHAADRPMPALIGWHPWFRRQLSAGGPAKLSFEARKAFEVDHDLIPTGELIDAPPEPWNHCFVDAVADPVITWSGVLELTISSTLDHWVVFTEPEEALCVEPQSGPPNQLNANPVIVQPDDPLVGTMRLSWTGV